MSIIKLNVSPIFVQRPEGEREAKYERNFQIQ